jgi:hypothetical protein
MKKKTNSKGKLRNPAPVIPALGRTKAEVL